MPDQFRRDLRLVALLAPLGCHLGTAFILMLDAVIEELRRLRPDLIEEEIAILNEGWLDLAVAKFGAIESKLFAPNSIGAGIQRHSLHDVAVGVCLAGVQLRTRSGRPASESATRIAKMARALPGLRHEPTAKMILRWRRKGRCLEDAILFRDLVLMVAQDLLSKGLPLSTVVQNFFRRGSARFMGGRRILQLAIRGTFIRELPTQLDMDLVRSLAAKTTRA
jgi:hypothetical protein